MTFRQLALTMQYAGWPREVILDYLFSRPMNPGNPSDWVRAVDRLLA